MDMARSRDLLSQNKMQEASRHHRFDPFGNLPKIRSSVQGLLIPTVAPTGGTSEVRSDSPQSIEVLSLVNRFRRTCLISILGSFR